MRAVDSAVMSSIIGVIQGERSELGVVRADLRRIIEEAFRSGLDHLQLAQNTQGSRRDEELRKARDNFIRAKNVELAVNSGRAAIYVGACSAMLGERRNALQYYESGYRTFALFERDCFDRLSAPRIVKDFFEELECASLGKLGLSRRMMLQRVVNGLVITPGVRDDLTNLYEYMRPASYLLKEQGSPLVFLAKPALLTKDSVPERMVRRLEQRCKLQFK